MATWAVYLATLQKLRGKAALNWLFKSIDIVSAPPLTDQLKHYSKVHERRTERLTHIETTVNDIHQLVLELKDQVEAMQGKPSSSEGDDRSE